MNLHIDVDKRSDIFTKYHIVPLSGVAVHEFLEAEPITALAHDHACDFVTHIREGSYVERNWYYHYGIWKYTDTLRETGTHHTVQADHIHQIIEQPQGRCVTLTVWGPIIRTWRFWRFDNGRATYREHDSDEWKEFEFQPHIS